MIYEVENKIFEIFPTFTRGVLIATDVNNHRFEPDLHRLLSCAVADANRSLSVSEQERLSIWDEVYRRFGSDPDKFTPSIRFLYEQIRRGKASRPISNIVDIFNIISLRWIVPCGGDDLGALGGDDLRLGFAVGDETFAPLFKPSKIEHPTVGEVIYYSAPTKRIMCRRWTWRNADFSKIRPETNVVAINVDMMSPPFTQVDLHTALHDLADLVLQFCGGNISIHVLDQSSPKFSLPTIS